MEADATVGPEGIAHVFVGHLAVEPLEVEMAAGPALGVAVLGVVGIGNDVEEVGVAADAADILGRSGTGAVDAAGGAPVNAGEKMQRRAGVKCITGIRSEQFHS